MDTSVLLNLINEVFNGNFVGDVDGVAARGAAVVGSVDRVDGVGRVAQINACDVSTMRSKKFSACATDATCGTCDECNFSLEGHPSGVGAG